MIDITPLVVRNGALAEQILNSHLEFVPARFPDAASTKPASYVLIKPNNDEDSVQSDPQPLLAEQSPSFSPSTESTPQTSDEDHDSAVLTPVSSPESDSDDDELDVGELKFVDEAGDEDDHIVSESEREGESESGSEGESEPQPPKNLSTTNTSSSPSIKQFYDINEITTDKGSRQNSHIVKSWRSLTITPMGLENRSVTCYMNAAMQAIFHVPAMAHYLMDIAQGKYKNTITNASVSNDLALLLKRLYEPGKKRRVYPAKIIRRLSDINCMMSEWQQEDSHEYFMSLISRLQEDSVPKGKKLNSSIIHEVFGGNIDQKVTCKTCNHVSTTHQDFYDLPVSFSAREAKAFKLARSGEDSTSSSSLNSTHPVTHNSKFSLEGSIQDFFSPELIKPDSKTKSGYQCEKCKSLTSAVKISRINDAPEYLTVHIKRFKFQGSHSQKLKETMKYPLDLDLTKYSVSGEPIRYKLMSVIVHEGRTVSSGHYVALCRQPNNTWAEYDDECVSKVSEKTVLRQNSAYMLIYSRLTRIKQTAPVAKPFKGKVGQVNKQKEMIPLPKQTTTPPQINKRQQLDDEIDQIFTKKAKVF